MKIIEEKSFKVEFPYGFNITQSSNLDCNKAHLAFMGWFYLNSVQVRDESILFRQAGQLVGKTNADDDFELVSQKEGSSAAATMTTTWTARGTWTHVVAREELANGQVDIYFDGAEQLSSSHAFALAGTASEDTLTLCTGDCNFVKHFHKICGLLDSNIDEFAFSYMRQKFVIVPPSENL